MVSRRLKRRKVIKWGFRYHKFSPRFCVYKWASSLFPGIVFKFHMVERWTVRIAIITLTSPIEDINVQPEAHSLVLETKDCFVSLVTHLNSKKNVCNCKHWCLPYTQGNANPLTFKHWNGLNLIAVKLNNYRIIYLWWRLKLGISDLLDCVIEYFVLCQV